MSNVEPISTNTTDPVYYGGNTGVDKVDGADAQSSAFADLLSDAISQMSANNGIYAGQGAVMPGAEMMPGSLSSMQGINLMMPVVTNTLEQTIMKASESGDSKDAMMALLMLMMMMESSSGSGDSSGIMMQMMAAMMQSFQDKDTLRNDFMYNSGAQPQTLDAIDEAVFQNTIPANIPEITGTYEAELPLEWWRPTIPSLVSTPHDRSPEMYRAVIAQFNVENAERYRPGREGNTYCNIYVWDVTRAMGAELPYYSEPSTGAPREYPDTKGANVNGAIAMDKWLKTHGAAYGWTQVSAEEAQMHANMGKPVVASGGDKGHISMVCPSNDGQFDPVRGVTLAQAGRLVSNHIYISGVYGSSSIATQVTYWVHD